MGATNIGSLLRRVRRRFAGLKPLTVPQPGKDGATHWVEAANFHVEDGLVWPIADEPGPRGRRRRTADLRLALDHCRDRRSVVQAGGHCGVWPLALSGMFTAVYTFEPDGENFSALALNTAAKPNIIRLQAALGDNHALIDLSRAPHTTGANFVAGTGFIPTLRIDDLALESCDLIVLDIEGSEMAAMKGADETIMRTRPVIIFEDKGHSRRYGVEQGEVEKWLSDRYQYRVVARPRRDIIMVGDAFS